jgi:type II secretory pathway pseudopilin PulG
MYQQINLYQPIFRKQRQVFSAATMAQALGVITAALLAIYFYASVKVSALEAEVVQLEGRETALMTQLARMDPALGANRRAELEAQLTRLNATLEGQQRLIDELRKQPLGDAAGFSAYLAALGRQRTAELWLTAFAINGGTGAIELEGRTLRPELVPEYMQRLGREAALSAQVFDSFELERDTETGEATFRATSRKALTFAKAAEHSTP